MHRTFFHACWASFLITPRFLWVANTLFIICLIYGCICVYWRVCEFSTWTHSRFTYQLWPTYTKYEVTAQRVADVQRRRNTDIAWTPIVQFHSCSFCFSWHTLHMNQHTFSNKPYCSLIWLFYPWENLIEFLRTGGFTEQEMSYKEYLLQYITDFKCAPLCAFNSPGWSFNVFLKASSHPRLSQSCFPPGI